MSERMNSTAVLFDQELPCMLIGIDDGFACTKIALPDGRVLAIPSCARVGRSKVTWMSRARPMIFEYETNSTVYSVGDVEAESTRFDGYAVSGLNRAIVQHALQCADLEGAEISAVSGLPVSTFYRSAGSRRREVIEAKVQSLLQPVMPKNGALPAEIIAHQVLPEALAAWYDYVIDEDGPAASLDQARARNPIAVVDIGGRTTDTVVVRDQGIVHDASGSCPLGIQDAMASLADRLEEQYDLPALDPRVVSTAFEHGTIRLFGHDHDVKGEVRAVKQELVERLHAHVQRQLGGGADLDCVLLVGGGVIELREQIEGWFPNQRTARQPAFANARGMLKYLRYVCDN